MHTAVLALLEIKGLITRAEGEKMVEFINNSPQPSQLADAHVQVGEFIDRPVKMPSGKVESKPSDRFESKTAAEANEIDEAVKGKTSKKSGEK